MTKMYNFRVIQLCQASPTNTRMSCRKVHNVCVSLRIIDKGGGGYVGTSVHLTLFPEKRRRSEREGPVSIATPHTHT